MENNPYKQCGELEDSLNRNQRDVFDYFMLYLDDDECTVSILLSILRYIIEDYDGQIRMSDEEIGQFWSNFIIFTTHT